MAERPEPRKMSRRRLLYMMGAVAVESGLLGYVGVKDLKHYLDGRARERSVPIYAPGLEDYENEATHIEDPVYRAASAIVISVQPDLNEGMGHAGLYRFQDGLYLMTQQHVIKGTSGFAYEIPGISVSGISNDSWQHYPNIVDRSIPDSNVRWKLQGHEAEMVQRSVDAGQIASLTVSDGRPKVGDAFVTPVANKGTLSRLTYDGVEEGSGLYRFKIQNEYVCAGFSGQPVLVADANGDITARSIGLIAGGNFAKYSEFLYKQCGDSYMWARPHVETP